MDDDLQIVEIFISGNSYKIACKSSEHENITLLADKFIGLVNSITKSNTSSKGNDASIFLIAGLTLLDKLEDLTQELSQKEDSLSLYKPYFDCYSQNTLSIQEIISFTLMRIEKLEKYLKKS